MKKISIVTGTRSEYGLLSPLIRRLQNDSEFDVYIAVTGSHLSPQFGNTYKEIEKDGFKIHKKIDILMSSDSPVSVTKSMGLAMNSFGEYFSELSPDLLVILGDRYEIFAVASAAAVLGIPIAHLHGGEVTLGAYDEYFRHSITKMSTLHFTSCEEHRRRVIQLGEQPERVFNVGAIGIENILTLPLMSIDELEKSIDFKLGDSYALGTFHPVTLESISLEEQVNQFIDSIQEIKDMKFILTKANADNGGRLINSVLEDFQSKNSDRVTLHTNLGQIRYLSAIKYCKFVIGNSSSGLIEAPTFHVPTINIGNRQKGRMRGKTVIDCSPEKSEIMKAIEIARSRKFLESIRNEANPYGDGDVSAKIVNEIKRFFLISKKGISMEFYDLFY